ncbi:MAG: tRNA dihydrouridine(20/20a) synthase DusA [Deltaproteobacteria bacterium]|nr:tRNA dihydrouridine(20/20a) synthase DusA [Deltaproteobacteria bacterium]
MTPPKILSVAPMMERTDRHFRFFIRQISKRTLVYSEMITAVAIVRGQPERLLELAPNESPVSLQLGGDDPKLMAEAARVGAELGYDEINLNVGCPSERVQRGRFGACLMAEPELVAACVAEIRAKVSLPVTVKHRIGIDERDSYEDMTRFMDVVASAGTARFIVHARRAVLGGLDPHENRTIPPLRYELVHRHKRERPERIVEINGGIRTLAEAVEHARHVDGAMIGRAAYDDPFLFAEADRDFYGDRSEPPTRQAVAEAMIPYAEAHTRRGGKLLAVTRGMMGLYTGRRGSRVFRRALATGAERDARAIREAVRAVERRFPRELESDRDWSERSEPAGRSDCEAPPRQNGGLADGDSLRPGAANCVDAPERATPARARPEP